MGLPVFKTDSPAYVSPEDYLRLENEAFEKHEYIGGVVRAMAGASFAHNQICNGIAFELTRQLRGTGCTPVGSDQRVHVRSKVSFLYPDLSVVCGKPSFLADKKPDTLTNPTLLVEVLSPTTKGNDRHEKYMLYCQIESLRQYLLLDSEAMYAELYTRQADGQWLYYETRDPAATLDLGSIGCRVRLADIYQDVELSAAGQ